MGTSENMGEVSVFFRMGSFVEEMQVREISRSKWGEGGEGVVGRK